MASVKKKEHLEAGKRRLEEFRKKKAADRAKKSANHLHANVDENSNQPVANKNEIHTEANGKLISDGVSESIVNPTQVVNDKKNSNSVLFSEVVYSNTQHNPFNHSTFSTEITPVPLENKEIDRYDGSWSSRVGSTKFSVSSYGKNDDYSASAGVSGRHDDGFPHDQSVALSSQVTEEYGGISNQPSYGQLNQDYSKAIDTDFTFAKSANANVSRENFGSIQPNKSSYGSLLDIGLTLSSNEDSAYSATKISALFPQVSKQSCDAVEPSNSSISNVGERKLNDYFSNLSTSNSTNFWPTGSQSSASSTGLYTSSNSPLSQAVAETNSRRSRPSFLDTINLSKIESGRDELFSPKAHDSSTFAKPLTENEKFQFYSKLEAPYGDSAFDKSTVSLVPTGNGNDMYGGATLNNTVDRENFFSSRKQDEDFAALEQHIEDLTQEKFSLQRALEESRTLADSLAAENSSLTDSYNQQGSIVNQLKYEMEMLQEEIKAHLVELDAVKMEYSNARLECTAADERASMLASEVISLEEKALKLRSSELKLERQLENSQAELSSFKKKLSSLEKDRQDLHSTIDALREEKKLLQAKLRKTSSSGISVDAGKGPDSKKDVSTSTEDLYCEGETNAAAVLSNETDNDLTSLLPENRQFNLEFTSSRIPSDQLRMIQNINTLISELALEKEELVQALVVKSSESSKLKELNKELSRKLEVQTQRLELLTAQSMANESIPVRQLDPHNMVMDNTLYADEGDEVVERVLGWIMKLFPGGPSRRRNGKHI